MYPIFSAFKRHYRKVRYVGESMYKTGTFGYRSSFTKAEGFDARVLTPDSEFTSRFIILMYRFLDPSDVLYYRAIWRLLQQDFAHEIPSGSHDIFEQFDGALAAGSAIKFRYNDSDLSAEQIYRIMAEGEFFARKDEARKFLQGIAHIPMADELFRYQFYDYSTTAFKVVTWLLDLIQQVEETDAFKARFGDLQPSSYQCIFCLTTNGKFTSEEHVIPEALANTDWILPKGYVCDRCNNGPLAKLDNVLAASPLFAYQRIQYLPYDKDGRLPEARFGSITWKRTSPHDILISEDPGADVIKFGEEAPDGWSRFSFKETYQNTFDERTLARALCKVALELIAADHGHQYACAERYNAVRAFIIKAEPFRNNLLLRTKYTPKPQIAVQYIPFEQGTLVEINLYGVSFLLNLEEHPKMELNDHLRDADLISLRLTGKSSWQSIHFEMVPDTTTLQGLPEKYWPKLAESNSATEVDAAEANSAPEENSES